MQFFYVYKSLAHPERDGLVQPLTLEERLLHVREAGRRLDTDWTWLADAPDNQVKDAFGNRNNSEFVINPDGVVVRARNWSKAAELRADLAEFVGEVSPPTSVADLDRKPASARRDPKVARKVVPRVDMPNRARPLKVSAEESSEPYYLKLRADADLELVRYGSGNVRLGFWLDPIHRVHWNNLAEPLKFHFVGENGAKIEPVAGTAPKVEQEADSDPREFLVRIENAKKTQPLRLEVSYFPCHDVEQWCKAVTQQFVITVEEDPHAGRAQGSGNSSGRKPGRPGGSGSPMPARILARYDADKDGKVAKSEANGKMAERFERMDADGDGFVTEAEIKAHFGPRSREKR